MFAHGGANTVWPGRAVGWPPPARWRGLRAATGCTAAVLLALTGCGGAAGKPAAKASCTSPSAAASGSASPYLCGALPAPTGGTWQGPIHLDLSVTGKSSDSGTADGQVVLVIDSSGDVSGTVKVHRTAGCTRYPIFLQLVRLHVTGEDSHQELTLHATPASPLPVGTTGICGFPDGVVRPPLDQKNEPGGSPYEPFVIHITSATTASGTGSGVDPDFGDNINWRYTITLTRQS